MAFGVVLRKRVLCRNTIFFSRKFSARPCCGFQPYFLTALARTRPWGPRDAAGSTACLLCGGLLSAIRVFSRVGHGAAGAGSAVPAADAA